MLRPGHAAALALVLALGVSRRAAAQCTVDIDCPGPTCGSSVCQWSVGGHTCVAAGTDVQGYDGWCVADSDCKCAGMGATCATATQHCTFTVPQSAPGGGDASGSMHGEDTTTTPPGCALGGVPGDAGGAAVLVAGLHVCTLIRRRPRAPRASTVPSM